MMPEQTGKPPPPRAGQCPPAVSPPPPRAERGRGRVWWAAEARVCGAEMVGTALLVVLSVAAGSGGAPAAGLVVAALVQCLDHVSGAMFNPTVLLTGVVWGRVAPARALHVLAAQLAGAVLGAAGLRALAAGAGTGVTQPAACGARVALALEAAGGAVLALANCASWDARNLHLRDSWPLRLGATVAALSYSAEWCSGASFNPARSFGPALLHAHWRYHWVYWLGPLGGALAATLLYVCVWRTPATPAPHAPHAVS